MNQSSIPGDWLAIEAKPLEEALWLVEARLSTGANIDLLDPIWSQLLAKIARPSSQTSAAQESVTLSPGFQTTIKGIDFSISLEIVSSSTLNASKSSYQAATENSRERISLNADRLRSAATFEIESILLTHIDEALLQQPGNQQTADALTDLDNLIAAKSAGLNNDQTTLAVQRSNTAIPAVTANPDTLASSLPNVINLDLIDTVYHLKGCGCGNCGLQDPLTAEAKQAKVKPTATSALIGPGTPVAAPAAAASIQTLADYLGVGYWSAAGTVPRKYNLSATGNNPNNGVLLYNVSGWATDPDGLTLDRRALVRRVFKDYQAYLGINFVETTSTGTEVDFFFRDNASGAYAAAMGTSYSDGVDWTEINIAANWYGSSSAYNGYTPKRLNMK